MLTRSRELDLESERFTENTRGAYPLEFIGNADPTGMAGQPRNLVLLAADAFGILPPISRLTHAQAAYHFLSGYTAKLAGTEIGVKPTATFSTCFGAPFMPRHPGEYARMLVERMERYGAQAWLVNTGWTGGPYGTGERMNINHTRSMVRAALDGRLDDVPTVTDPIFGVEVPTSCPDVPSEVLQPRDVAGPRGLRQAGEGLAKMFAENFERYAEVSGTTCEQPALASKTERQAWRRAREPRRASRVRERQLASGKRRGLREPGAAMGVAPS